MTLRPHSAEERRQFWDFRISDISNMYTYYILIDAITWVLLLVLHLYDSNTMERLELVILLFEFLMHSVVWMLRDRLKKALASAILAVSIVTSLLQLV